MKALESTRASDGALPPPKNPGPVAVTVAQSRASAPVEVSASRRPSGTPEAPPLALTRIDREVAARARTLEAWLSRPGHQHAAPRVDDELRALFAGLRPGQRTDLLSAGRAHPTPRRPLAAALGLGHLLDVQGIRDHSPPTQPRYVPVRTFGTPKSDAVDWEPKRVARSLAHHLTNGQAKPTLDLISALPVDARRAVAIAYEETRETVDLATCRLRRDLAMRLGGRDRLIALAYWDNASGRLEAHDEVALLLLRLPSHEKLLVCLEELSPFQQTRIDEALTAIHAAAAERGRSSPDDAVRAKIAAAKAALYPKSLAAIPDSFKMRVRPATRAATKVLLEAPREVDGRPSARVADARALRRALRGGAPHFKPERKDAFRLLERLAFCSPDGLANLREVYDHRYGEGQLDRDLERLRSRRTGCWGERLDQILSTMGAPEEHRVRAAARYVALATRQVIEGKVSDRDLTNTWTRLVAGSVAVEEGVVSIDAVEKEARAAVEGASAATRRRSTGSLRGDMRAAPRPRASSKAILDVVLGGETLTRADLAAVQVHDAVHNDDGRSRLKMWLGKAGRRQDVLEMLDRPELASEARVAHVRATERAYAERYGEVSKMAAGRLREDVLSTFGGTVSGGARSAMARLLDEGQLRPGDRIYHAMHDREAPADTFPAAESSARRFARIPRRLFGLGGPNVARVIAEYSHLDSSEGVEALEVYAENRLRARGASPKEVASPERGQTLLRDALAKVRSHRAHDLLAQIDIDLASLAGTSPESVRALCEKLGIRLDIHRGDAFSRFLMDLFGPQGKWLDDRARRVSALVERVLALPPGDEAGALRAATELANSMRSLVEEMHDFRERKEEVARNARLAVAAAIAIALFSAKTFGGAVIPAALAPILSGTVAGLLCGVRRAVLGPSYGRSDLATDLRISAAYLILAQAHPNLPISVGGARLLHRLAASRVPAPPPRVDPEVWERLGPG